MYAGVHATSFARAAQDLEQLADLRVGAKQGDRLTEQIGRERVDQRGTAVADFRCRPLVQREGVANPERVVPQVVMVSVDGGRLQIRERDELPGTVDSHWRESKVAVLETLASDVHEVDPDPDLPRCFLDAARTLKKLMPSVRLIFLTINPDPALALEALRIGASGYLLKGSSADELLKTVRDVVRGVSYVPPQTRQEMKERLQDKSPASGPKHLTPRNREILQMLAEGRSIKEIAYILEVSIYTVRFHKHRIMKKLEIASDAKLVQYAIKHALVQRL